MDHLPVALLSKLRRGRCLSDVGREGARPLLERALRINETTFGPQHPTVAKRLSNLAVVLQDIGDAAGARPLLERALRIYEKTFGPEHPTMGIIRGNSIVCERRSMFPDPRRFVASASSPAPRVRAPVGRLLHLVQPRTAPAHASNDARRARPLAEGTTTGRTRKSA